MITGIEQPTIYIRLSEMVVLDLHCNNISGQIPPSISYTDGMKFLDLSNNNLCGTIPHCFGRMNNHLLVLNLRKNRLSGIMPQKSGGAMYSRDN